MISAVKKSILSFFILCMRTALYVFDLYCGLRGRVLIWRFGSAIGEQLMISCPVEFLSEEYGIKSHVLTSAPALFEKNPHVAGIISAHDIPLFWKGILIKALKSGHYKHIHHLMAETPGFENFTVYMRHSPHEQKHHIIYLQTRHWPYEMDKMPIETHIYLDDKEKRDVLNKFGLQEKAYALIHSQGKTSYTELKEWGTKNMQSLIGLSEKDVQWVQVGVGSDVPLEYVLDVRGQTNLRELAALLSCAQAMVCVEGLYTHLAAAVGTPSITIYSGFHTSSISAYDNTVIVEKDDVECKPCWLLDEKDCPYDRFCIKDITPQQVWNKMKECLLNVP